LDIDDAISALRFQLIISTGGGRFDILQKGKLLYGGEFTCGEDEVNAKAASQQIKLMEALRSIYNTSGINQKVVVISHAMNRVEAILFLYALIKGEKDVSLTPMKSSLRDGAEDFRTVSRPANYRRTHQVQRARTRNCVDGRFHHRLSKAALQSASWCPTGASGSGGLLSVSDNVRNLVR
jgi:hypothetical protein